MGIMVPYVLADGISGEGFLILGAVYGILPLIAIVLIEWPVWSYGARLKGKPALKACLAANLLSALFAIPLAIALDAQSSHWVNTDLYLYEQSFLRYAVIRYAVYLLFSIIVEGAVFAVWFSSARKVVVLRTAVLANVLSYLIISPVYYQLTKPRLSGAQFVADTAWAPESPEWVTFIDRATNHLVSCDLRGGNRRTLVPAAMDSYLLFPDRTGAVYRRGSELWWARGERRQRLTDALPADRGSPMGMVDVYVSGRFVAYPLASADAGRSEGSYDVHVWDAESGDDRVVRSGVKGWGSLPVRWTDDGHNLLVGEDGYGQAAERIHTDLSPGSSALVQKASGAVPRYAGCFAPLGQDRQRSRPYQIEFADQRGEWHVTSWSVLTNRYASVARGARWKDEGSVETMSLGDNPGLYMVWARVREWGDFAFVPGTQVAVLEDQTNRVLYVVDPATGRVGKLAEGSEFVLNRNRYRRGVSDDGLGPWAVNGVVSDSETR